MGFIEAVKREICIKKIILLVLLAACLVFMITQKDVFYKDRPYLNGVKVPPMQEVDRLILSMHPDDIRNDMDRWQARVAPDKKYRVDLAGDVTVSQEFEAEHSVLKAVTIYCDNPGGATTQGRLAIRLLDSEGKKFQETEVDASLVANQDVTQIDFLGNTEALNANEIIETVQQNFDVEPVRLDKGEKYTLEIESEGIKGKGAFGVYLCSAEDAGYVSSVNGKEMSGRYLFSTIKYSDFNELIFFSFIFVIMLAVIFVLLPMDYITEKNNIRRAKKGRKDIELSRVLLRIMFFLTPIVIVFINSKIAGDRTADSLKLIFSFKGMLNIFIIGFFWWLLYVVSNRVKIAIVGTTAVGFFFAFMNYLLVLFRDCPLLASDLSSIGTGLDVAASYHIVLDKPCLWAIVISVIWVCAAIALKGGKGLALKRRLAAGLGLLIWAGAFYYTVFENTVFETFHVKVSGFKPKLNYKKNGYVLSFFITVNTSRIQKPAGYSPDRAKEIAAGYESDKAVSADSPTEKTPNVVAIMVEAFSDLKAVGDFKTNTEYMPFYKGLNENTIKGTLNSSVFGGSTANTEFEFLTGFTTAFLPFRSVPYATMVKEETPSISWDLKADSYGGNVAFHPGMANSYSRDTVYPLLGFEKHVSFEDMVDPEKLRAYVSDRQDFRTLVEEYEKYRRKDENKPFYIFNVTIQNHSDYKLSTGVVKSGISITDSGAREEEAEQYLNCIKKTDDAIKELISYFENVDEPTVVVLFGDHQPRVGSLFYDSLYGKDSEDLELDETARKYEVPFMIWANYDIGEKNGVELSANYLSSYFKQEIGLPMTAYDKYLMDLYKDIPVVSAICYKDRNGRFYELKDKSKYSERLNEYSILQYNGFVDTKNRADDIFSLKK